MKILILDDDDMRHRRFAQWFAGYDCTHCFTYDQFAKAFGTGKFDYTFLDHDLNDNQYRSVKEIDGDNIPGYIGPCTKELTGQDAARLVAGDPERAGHVVIHSWNPYGAREMEKTLRDIPGGVTVWTFNPKEDLKLK